MTADLSRDLPTIALLGSGTIATAVREELRIHYRVDLVTPEWLEAQGIVRATALVVASDGLGCAHATAQRFALRQKVPWLPVSVDDARIHVGPRWLPGTSGCPGCARLRQGRNTINAAGRSALVERFGAQLATRPSALLTQTTAVAAAALVADQVSRLLAGRSRSEIVSLALENSHPTTHAVLPDPLCPDCSNIPEDGPEPIEPRKLPKLHSTIFRQKDLAGDWQALQDRYVDSRTGIVHSILPSISGGCATVTAISAPAATHPSAHGYGREFDFASARVAAVAEALERLAGIQPRGRRTIVRASYLQIADQAIDPAALGLYPDARYDSPGFPFRRYHPELQMAWVWGYSFRRAAPVLVPESVSYYGHNHGISFETSNGCAVGSGIEEAILHGLLEVAERDAFLLTWYGRMPAPRVDIDSAIDRRIPLMAESMRHEFGYELLAFETTVEQKIPSFWLMARDTSADRNRPTVLCGAGAHLLPEKALLGGIRELLTMLRGFVSSYDPHHAGRLVADGDAVCKMDDHSTLYGHPGAFSRLEFLPIDGPSRPIGEGTWPVHDDLGDDLGELVARYARSGLDVVAVDQTSLEHEAGGLSCAKVIVPGAIPMTFGHRNRRDHGLPRIQTVPRLLGYRDRDLDAHEINPFPHPFP